MVLSLINRVRRNHGLEHATITGLLEEGARPPLAGIATPFGFFVYARVSTEDVTQAAREALRRLQAGRKELAVSPYCGTNLIVGALIAALASAIIMRKSRSRFRQIPAATAAILAATVLGRPLGNLVQKYLTTSGNAQGAAIRGVRRLKLGGIVVHLVHTSLSSE